MSKTLLRNLGQTRGGHVARRNHTIVYRPSVLS